MLRYFTTLKSDEISSIAIGGFDGMHLAHQKLIEKLDEKGVILVIDKGFSNLTCGEDRCEFVKNGCVFLDLADVKQKSANEFVQFLKDEFKSLKRVVVGYDFRFGKDRKGSSKDFEKEFEVVVVDEVVVDGVSVHSQVIREFIQKAEIKKANSLLGREYALEFKTKTGQGLGSKKLVATINLYHDKACLIPKDGVYVTKSLVDGKVFKSVTFIGKRQSVDGEFSIETHLLDTNLNYLPKKVKVFLVDFVRDNKRFDTLEQLKTQIYHDIKVAKETLDKK